jgi:hypothetical protein
MIAKSVIASEQREFTRQKIRQAQAQPSAADKRAPVQADGRKRNDSTLTQSRQRMAESQQHASC